MEAVVTGKSASSVFHLTHPGKQALYLKTADAPHVAELEAEHERLLWLEGRAPVPQVVAFKSSPHQAALLTRALPGANAIEASKKHWFPVARRLALALREMHAIATGGCPFDRRLAVIIDAARARTMAGLVDESDFDEERRNRRARDLLILLEQQQPAAERPVITHGDACLSNVIIEGSAFRGFVDCGRSGLSDAYQDLALASRSIASHYGPEYVDHFFEAYGLREVDDGKLAYYRLADEFF
jgi:aminoglycoside phosphotransferase